MTAVRAMARANRSGEVCALLNVYSEGIHLSEHVVTGVPHPLENATDAMKQMQTLFIALGLASRRLEDDSRNRIKEALFVFSAALERLRSLPDTNDERMLRPERSRVRNDLAYVAERSTDRSAGDARPFA
jgi:hypothetical protein